jgi:hypothetical protein
MRRSFRSLPECSSATSQRSPGVTPPVQRGCKRGSMRGAPASHRTIDTRTMTDDTRPPEPPIVDVQDWPPKRHSDEVREQLDREVGTLGVGPAGGEPVPDTGDEFGARPASGGSGLDAGEELGLGAGPAAGASGLDSGEELGLDEA